MNIFDAPTSVIGSPSLCRIQIALESLEEAGHHLEIQLRHEIASERALEDRVARLNIIRAQSGASRNAVRGMSQNLVAHVSSSSRKISAAVRQLDLEQERVKNTLTVVEQVSNLKDCVLGVTGSMGAPQDWETAAVYLNRASKIPAIITHSVFAENVVPTAEVPDPPPITISLAAESLRVLFLKEFENAASNGNGSKVTRFFKLFPLIGKPEIGLDVYGHYVCQAVASRARANLSATNLNVQSKESLFFAIILTKLFENIAQIVESHANMVERHYGFGQMTKVIERLQSEADVQGGIILETWADERGIDRKLKEIKSYAFTFLVQSFLVAQVNGSGQPLADLPSRTAANMDAHSSEEVAVDMKDIDSLMSEMTLMLGRWSLYTRFLTSKCPSSNGSPGVVNVPSLITGSGLQRKMMEKVITPFNTMATFFLRHAVERAFQLDEQPTGLSLDDKPLNSNPPYITSAVDDVMFMVSQVLEKSLETCQSTVVANTIPTISRVLCSDFIGMIQRKLRDEHYPRAASKGGPPPYSTVIAFLVLLNNLDVAIDYNKRIVAAVEGKSSAFADGQPKEQSSSTKLQQNFPLASDADFVRKRLNALEGSFSEKATELIGDGMFVAFKNVLKPRIRLVLMEAFRDTHYHAAAQGPPNQVSNESDRSEMPYSNVPAATHEKFRLGWERFNKPLIRILTEHNSERLMALSASYLSEILEKRIWSFYGRVDRSGAVEMERDVAGIINVIVRGGRYKLREFFVRCTQICQLMNMEEDEWHDLEPAISDKEEGPEWLLDGEERLRARSIVI